MGYRELLISSISDKNSIPKPRLKDTDLNIVFTGDSLTEGVGGGSFDQIYPNIVKGWLEGRCKSLSFASFGIAGQTTKEMLLNDPAKVDPLVDENKVNLLITWEDVNAILIDGVSAQENYDDFSTYTTARKTAGYDYIIHNAGFYYRLPLTHPWTATFPANKQPFKDYLDLCLNNPLPFVDVMNDLRNLPNVGGLEDQNIDSRYFDDEVHPTYLGYQEIANYIITESILKIFYL